MPAKIDVADDTIVVQEDLNSVIIWTIKNNKVLQEDKSISTIDLLRELSFTTEYSEYGIWKYTQT